MMNELTTTRAHPVKESEIFGALNHIDGVTDAVVFRLSGMSDDEVLMTRDYAREVGKAAWRIECACDAEVVNRTKARRGRGNIDADKSGVMATVNRVATEVGAAPSTILKNAQIHNTFFADPENTLRAESILEEKQFFKEALSADDPIAAIEAIAKKKSDNPFYSSRDARTEIAEGRLMAVPESESESKWSDYERDAREKAEAGQAVVIHLAKHQGLRVWAEERGLYVRCDRQTLWGNPFVLGDDGDREAVIRKYAFYYLPYKNKLLAELPTLAGKVLGCWCAPEACHCDVLARRANGISED